jgi:hypothetical protein
VKNVKKGLVSAADLLKQLQADPTFVAQAEERDKIRRDVIRDNREAAAPVIAELVALGFSIESLAELRDRGTECGAAVPVLMRWLPEVQNLDVKQDIVRCLSIPSARPRAAPVLIAEFRNSRDETPTGLRWAIGNALDVVADDSVFDDMVELAKERAYGKAREMVVLALGNMTDPRAPRVLVDLLANDEVAGHAIMALGKLRAVSARSNVEQFLRHPREWIRKEAKRAIERIDGSG